MHQSSARSAGGSCRNDGRTCPVLLHAQERADDLGRHPKEGRGQPAVGLVAERTLRLRLRPSLDDFGIGLQSPADILILLGDVETIDRILHFLVERSQPMKSIVIPYPAKKSTI